MGDINAQSGAKRRAHGGRRRLEGETVGFPLKWRSFGTFLPPRGEKYNKNVKTGRRGRRPLRVSGNPLSCLLLWEKVPNECEADEESSLEKAETMG